MGPLKKLIPGLVLKRRNLQAIYDEKSHWYQEWYFELRLAEEIDRATRYGTPLALVVAFLTDDVKKNDRTLVQILQSIAANSLRRSDIPGILGDYGYGLVLPHTTPEQAEAVITRLQKAFTPYTVALGTSSYPEDRSNVSELLTLATHRAATASGEPQVVTRRSRQRRAR